MKEIDCEARIGSKGSKENKNKVNMSEDKDGIGSTILSLKDIQIARKSVADLNELLTALDSNSETGKEDTILFLVDQCRMYKIRCMLLLKNTRDTALLHSQGLALNDDLERVLYQHEAIARGHNFVAGVAGTSSSNPYGKLSAKRGPSGELVNEKEQKRKFENMSGSSSARYVGGDSLWKNPRHKELGWYFEPSEEELFEYLRRKISYPAYQAKRIRDGNVYNELPTELMGNGGPKKFFFAKRIRSGKVFRRHVGVPFKLKEQTGKLPFKLKEQTGKLPKWRQQGQVKDVGELGHKTTFYFHDPQGHTVEDFHLDEYSIDDNELMCLYVMTSGGSWRRENQRAPPVRFASSDSDNSDSEKGRTDMAELTDRKTTKLAQNKMEALTDTEEKKAKTIAKELDEFAQDIATFLDDETGQKTVSGEQRNEKIDKAQVTDKEIEVWPDEWPVSKWPYF
ncbi:hypothetical protein ACHQM5_018204 [Ranunculus cassubicifolius]